MWLVSPGWVKSQEVALPVVAASLPGFSGSGDLAGLLLAFFFSSDPFAAAIASEMTPPSGSSCSRKAKSSR